MTKDNADVRVAASPINWHNDDFPILGTDTSVETMLAGMQSAGYEGTALSSLFPTTAKDLRPLLEHFDLRLASGWHCTYLLTEDREKERERFIEFVQFLSQMETEFLTVAECSWCPFKPYPPGRFDQHFQALAVPLFPYQLPKLSPEQWRLLGEGLTEFSRIAADSGITVGYHPHMQTLVQDAEQLALLADAAPDLQFTIDTGHLAFAGADPLLILERYIGRTVYLHVKNVRERVVEAARGGSMSFEFAVVEGAFTVPGDGGIDFVPIFELLKRYEYRGWLLVEAEQNPLTSDPLLYAKLAREYIERSAGW